MVAGWNPWIQSTREDSFKPFSVVLFLQPTFSFIYQRIETVCVDLPASWPPLHPPPTLLQPIWRRVLKWNVDYPCLPELLPNLECYSNTVYFCLDPFVLLIAYSVTPNLRLGTKYKIIHCTNLVTDPFSYSRKKPTNLFLSLLSCSINQAL